MEEVCVITRNTFDIMKIVNGHSPPVQISINRTFILSCVEFPS